MKRNISDLLDTYREEAVDLDCRSPLSPTRIKELTMNKISPKKSRSIRFPLRLLAAAAVVAALSVSVFAVNQVLGAGALLQDFFAREEGGLSSSQVEVMDQMGRTFEGGVTSNGATITPIAALADENVYYLRLRVEAPEGTVLPDLDGDTDGYYQLSSEEGQIDLDLSAYQSYGFEIRLNWMPDSDPTDNVKEVVLCYTKQAGTDLNFIDGVSKPLTIYGLWIQDPYKEYTPVFTGEFTFDIGLHYESKVISLDCGGATYTDETYGYTNRLDRLELSPLSMSFQIHSNLPENDVLTPGLGRIYIVGTDGSVLWPEYDYPEEPLDERYDPSIIRDTFVYTEEGYIVFDEPLDLSQVDYIQYGGDQIPVNAE